jgi:hypothetical protein
LNKNGVIVSGIGMIISALASVYMYYTWIYYRELTFSNIAMAFEYPDSFVWQWQTYSVICAVAAVIFLVLLIYFYRK